MEFRKALLCLAAVAGGRKERIRRNLYKLIGVGFGVARSYCIGQCEGLKKRERAAGTISTLFFFIGKSFGNLIVAPTLGGR